MLVIPAVDIMDGKCVRLVKGDPAKSKVYFDDALEAAKLLESEVEIIHLIDLDAALGSGQNLAVIKKILNLKVKVQVGGGIRTLEKADILVRSGAFRIIFGTVAVQNPALIAEAISHYGSKRVAVAIDEKNGKATFHGWKDRSEINYLDLARVFEQMKVGAIVFTTIDVDGTLKGPEVEKIEKLVETTKIPIIASGGISSLNNLTTLGKTGIEGAIVGTALYEGKFTLKQALEAVKNIS
jgi:phosphoribosylformimino-5-aminoimidazole carboxamide ribotide isomerase